jgi:intein/homing endonuclease
MIEIKLSPELAEIMGVIIGDGCLYKIKKRNKYQTTITSDKKEIKYVNELKVLFESYFKYKFSVMDMGNALQLRNSSKAVGEQIINVGFKAGNKIENKIVIPVWIVENQTFLSNAVKGIFDTDGCVYRKYAHYAQIQFKFGSRETTQSVQEALKILNYNPTKIEKQFNKAKGVWGWKFYLSRQGEIDRFFKEISPRNEKHIGRFKKIRDGAAGI